MKRLFTIVTLAVLLTACAGVQSGVGDVINDQNSLGVLSRTSNSIIVTPVQPLAHVVLAITGDDLVVTGDACHPDGPVIRCEWPLVNTTKVVGVRGTRVSATASYRVQGETLIRFEVLK